MQLIKLMCLTNCPNYYYSCNNNSNNSIVIISIVLTDCIVIPLIIILTVQPCSLYSCDWVTVSLHWPPPGGAPQVQEGVVQRHALRGCLRGHQPRQCCILCTPALVCVCVCERAQVLACCNKFKGWTLTPPPLSEGGFCQQRAAVPDSGGALRWPLVDLWSLAQRLRPGRHHLVTGHASHTAAGAQWRLPVSHRARWWWGGSLSLIPPVNLLGHQTCERLFKCLLLSRLLTLLASRRDYGSYGPTFDTPLLLRNSSPHCAAS